MTPERPAPQPAPERIDTEAERALAFLVAGGLVEATKVEEARNLARSLTPPPVAVVRADLYDALRNELQHMADDGCDVGKGYECYCYPCRAKAALAQEPK